MGQTPRTPRQAVQAALPPQAIFEAGGSPVSIHASREQIVAIVPIRSFRNGKTRLTPVFDREAREALLRATAEGVVAAGRNAECVETVLVVSPDAEVLAWATRMGPGVAPLAQSGSMPGLNGAIAAGREWALAAGATAILSLFADLPFLTEDDIHTLVARPEPVVLGPDRHGEGTNALLLRLPDSGAAFQFAFGEGSLNRHIDEARRLGLDAGIVRAPGLAFDLDTPGDWADYLTARREWVIEAEPCLLPCRAGIA